MLRELHIRNIAVIEDVTIAFYNGFHVLTGETGAGKSILIDSINIALGQRTSKDLIRTGADSATVDIVFELSEQAEQKLNEYGVESDDGMLYISRQITLDGKSKCRINGHLVPLNLVKDISVFLLTIHGQHDNQTLLLPKYHIGFVDDYGNYDDIIEAYKNQYSVVRDTEKRIEALKIDEDEKRRKIELLSYQVDEISAAHLCPGEKAELEQKKEYLANIESIAENCGEAYSLLYGSEDKAAYDSVSTAVRCLENVSDYDSRINDLRDALESVLADMEDAAHELRSFADNNDYTPGELDSVQERLETITSLERKYGQGEDTVLKYLDSAKAELNEIEDSDVALEKLKNKYTEESEKLKKFALKLSAKRKEAAISLQTGVMKELAELDMQKMRFSVAVEPIEDNGELKYTSSGSDKVEFLISGNPGEGLKPLSKIASGGEMSRIMLALKSVLTDSDIVETLIFDEIDTGVSGRAAQKIAEKIRALSKKRQILCITHLAQIAGMANTHYLVKKESDDNHTYTSVIRLDNDARKYELARIIGGVKITDLTLQAAQEMLELAGGEEN